jgi:tetratricopeptide (TPR) repeat protein
MLRSSLIAGFVVLLALPLTSQQQDNSSQQQQNPPAQTSKSTQQKKDQQKDQPKKSPSQENPFPEAQSEAAAHQSQPQQNPNAAPDAPQPQSAPKADSPNKSAGPNSFPQSQSEKAEHDAQQQDQPGSAPPSSDEPSYSSSRVKGLDMPTTDETPPANLPPSQLPFDSKLAKKDANIGDYYMESGNWKGAHERFLEANRSDPGNAEAVFGLAESARHLHLDDEALRNYRLYLSALPNGPHAKEIRKALKQMGAEP